MSHKLCSFNKVQQNDIHSNYRNKPTNNCSLIGEVKVACQANKPRGQSGFQLSKIRSHIRLSLPTAEQNGMPNRRNTIKHNIDVLYTHSCHETHSSAIFISVFSLYILALSYLLLNITEPTYNTVNAVQSLTCVMLKPTKIIRDTYAYT